ncbi:hypothetical protein EOM39_06725 [Candidatus Gracilibacteria bacterium]|nr:hypothetical protein [Candidatus Gracilibacteria bacterium]
MKNENITIDLTYFELGTISDLVLGANKLNDVITIGTFTELFEANIIDFNKEINDVTTKFNTEVLEKRSEYFEEKITDEATGQKSSVLKEGKNLDDFNKEIEPLRKKFEEDMKRIKNIHVKKEVPYNVFYLMESSVMYSVDLSYIREKTQDSYAEILGTLFHIGKKLRQIDDAYCEENSENIPNSPTPELAPKEENETEITEEDEGNL